MTEHEFAHGLGRKPSPPDERDFAVARLEQMIFAGAAVPVLWNDPVVLDQGQTPHCVGYGGAGFMATAEAQAGADPTVTNQVAEALYAACKIVDGEPGAQDGSTVRTLAKVLKERGVIDAYAFGTFAEGKAWVKGKGPVVVGSRWDYSMEATDAQGFVHPDGNAAGGHCWLWHGSDDVIADNTGRQSWGEDWGMRGDFYLADADLQNILANGGELLMAVKLVDPVTPTPPTPPSPGTSEAIVIVRAIIAALGRVDAELQRLLKDIT